VVRLAFTWVTVVFSAFNSFISDFLDGSTYYSGTRFVRIVSHKYLVS
jgi:hypothetical protein